MPLILISLRSFPKPFETRGGGSKRCGGTFFAFKLKCWVRGIFEKPILGPHKTDRADLGKEGMQALCMQINASTFSKCSIHVEE